MIQRPNRKWSNDDFYLFIRPFAFRLSGIPPMRPNAPKVEKLKDRLQNGRMTERSNTNNKKGSISKDRIRESRKTKRY